MSNSAEKTSLDLQREIEVDRKRIENRIDAIQEKMSPGELIDEVLNYAKQSGGAEYVSNLGRALKMNPMPVALMGISLAWLMAKQNGDAQLTTASDPEYPLYSADGAIRRLGPPEIEFGSRYSYFTDNTGKRLKALTDEAGARAGHFIDEAGKTYRGFVDAGGKQIEQIADETGAMFDAASGWTAKTWAQVKDATSSVGSKASQAMSSLSDRSASAGASIQEQTTKLNDAILTHFRDQPLVGGALAFAVGAAIGAALPHSEMEDEMLGDTADLAKTKIADEAANMAEQGMDIASGVYEQAVSVAAEAHDVVKDRILEEVDAFKAGNGATEPKPR
ncbi:MULTISPECIES: DUF3618 domain-containing protein [unclassified Rhizobium]|uniref:DUF3618 domain-containing protein n=1 Tax=unclassified Rhizobium TaxID=2613769 RepID=UPI001607FC70|nr:MULTISPECIES: DUF3618 domain-containing protein [unclassified Rhizobium]MBB3318331.1 ElaB/YqjD/DUF883 family membrane-anchored ribosome-binding protein [Rhizobium sp. BK181]MCS4094132.1 ElaB/YqjD/DUF883 family membrane-anchored ribosome-binding protein [Rhizobium sp. BK176]